jgi:hypothetical protein
MNKFGIINKMIKRGLRKGIWLRYHYLTENVTENSPKYFR